ncbi:hypothetical protein BGZ57DRAFT_998045 [Hyaloscypha finlandica]|nr:hypothetical protein BGZ57DRAFT_998045 [Hyaloscypha finlandica]
MPSKLSIVLSFCFLWSAVLAAATPKYYLSLKGKKQGQLYHNNATSLTNVVQILGFNFSASAPRDIASGLPTGKSTFTPVSLYKEMDTSSPLLMQALTTNEIFQATITAVDPATNGNLATTFAWKLTNGGLTSVSYGAGSTQMVESIAMVFQKLEIDATAGGSTVSSLFNWQTPIA